MFVIVFLDGLGEQLRMPSNWNAGAERPVDAMSVRHFTMRYRHMPVFFFYLTRVS
jgi:hypothetical protein